MKLEDYLYKKKIMKKDFAKSVGCNPDYLGHIIRGLHAPSESLARKIFELTEGKVKIKPSSKRLQLRKKRGLPIKIDEDEEGGKAA